MKRSRAQKLRKCNRLSGALMAVAVAPQVNALSWEFGDGDWLLDLDTLISYSAQWRVENRDRDKFAYRDTGDLIADSSRYSLLINAEDGDFNFDRGDLVQNKISVVSELDLNRGRWGIFARARAYYDAVYDSGTHHDRADFATYNSGTLYGGDADFREFPSGTVDEHRDRVEMLDYFLYASGELPGERLFDVRLGSQVINWGEATFYQGINGLQNRADLIARNKPGVEVKEILLPTGALYGQVDLLPQVTFEAYYQYEWKETELNGVGSYFSDRDFLGPGAHNFLIAVGENVTFVAPKTRDDKPPDSGQWGTALHWVTDGGTDLGLYFVNAHNKAPAYQLHRNAAGVPESYTIRYFDDIKGYAASFTTVLGITNVQGEISYKQDAPVVNSDGDPEEGDVIALQIGGSHVLEPTVLWDDASVTFELAHTRIDSHSNDELRYDDMATALALRLELAYLNVMQGIDLRLPVFWQYTLDGTILEANMIDRANVFNVTLKAVYLNNLTAEVGYSAYFDGGVDHLLTDRDNVSVSVSYSF